MKLNAPAVGGVLTTFITMSDAQDEIDWEILGGRKTGATTNIFYKGIPEYGIHSTFGAIPNDGTIEGSHVYSIDWTRKSIIFSIDDVVVRTYLNDANAVSPATPAGQKWFPNTPSRVQFAIWFVLE